MTTFVSEQVSDVCVADVPVSPSFGGGAAGVLLVDARERYFVDVRDVVPEVQVDLRYAGCFNFVGEAIDGYLAPRCLLTREAALALRGVQEELALLGLGVKVYDGYRPQRAVDHFARWARDASDVRMRSLFYPNVSKKRLLARGYVAERSGHSRGSCVALTLMRLDAPQQEGFCDEEVFVDNGLDMGTPFDFFDPLSYTDNSRVPGEARENRLLLRSVMERNGFRNFPAEWWHYCLEDEPFEDVYFDFLVR